MSNQKKRGGMPVKENLDGTCRFCAADYKLYCQSVHGCTGYVCTREKGHPGQHVACSSTAHDVQRWNKTAKEL